VGPSGAVRALWTFNTTAPVGTSSPVIGSDGAVYIASQAGTLSAIDGSTGSVKWAASLDAPGAAPAQIWPSPALSSTSVFIGGDNGVFRSYSQATGAVQWTYLFNATLTSPGAVLSSSPVITSGGAVIVGCNDYSINALDQNTGVLLWRTPTTGKVYPYAAFSATGTIYMGSKDGIFRALYPNNGGLRWSVGVGAEIPAPAAVGRAGAVYFGDKSGVVHALAGADGSTLWTFATRGPIVSRRLPMPSRASPKPCLFLAGTDVASTPAPPFTVRRPCPLERQQHALHRLAGAQQEWRGEGGSSALPCRPGPARMMTLPTHALRTATSTASRRATAPSCGTTLLGDRCTGARRRWARMGSSTVRFQGLRRASPTPVASCFIQEVGGRTLLMGHLCCQGGAAAVGLAHMLVDSKESHRLPLRHFACWCSRVYR
jgi:outer membrane protein assembly factor BamB